MASPLVFRRKEEEKEPTLWERIGGLPGAAGTAIRAGSGFVTNAGGLIGALAGAGGEGLAELVEAPGKAIEAIKGLPEVASHFANDPLKTANDFLEGAAEPIKRIGVEAAVGAVPFNRVLKVGKVADSAIRGGVYSGAGEAAREWAQGRELDPKSIALHGAIGAGTNAAFAKLLGIGHGVEPPTPPPPGSEPKDYEIELSNLEKEKGRVSQPPRTIKGNVPGGPKPPTIPPSVPPGPEGQLAFDFDPDKYPVPYGAMSAAERTAGKNNPEFTFQQEVEKELNRRLNGVDKHLQGGLDDLDAAINAERKATTVTRKQNAADQNRLIRAEETADRQRLSDQFSFIDALEKGLGKSIDDIPDPYAAGLDDLDEAIAAADKEANIIRGLNRKNEGALSRAEQAADLQQTKADMKAAEEADKLERIRTEREKAGVRPQEPSFGKSLSAKNDKGERESMSQRFAKPEKEAGEEGADEAADTVPFPEAERVITPRTVAESRANAGALPPAGTEARFIYDAWRRLGRDHKLAVKLAAKGRRPLNILDTGEDLDVAPAPIPEVDLAVPGQAKPISEVAPEVPPTPKAAPVAPEPLDSRITGLAPERPVQPEPPADLFEAPKPAPTPRTPQAQGQVDRIAQARAQFPDEVNAELDRLGEAYRQAKDARDPAAREYGKQMSEIREFMTGTGRFASKATPQPPREVPPVAGPPTAAAPEVPPGPMMDQPKPITKLPPGIAGGVAEEKLGDMFRRGTKGDEGYLTPQMAAHLIGGVGGAALGGSQGETPEEHAQNALLGFLGGVGTGHLASKSKLIPKFLEDEVGALGPNIRRGRPARGAGDTGANPLLTDEELEIIDKRLDAKQSMRSAGFSKDDIKKQLNQDPDYHTSTSLNMRDPYTGRSGIIDKLGRQVDELEPPRTGNQGSGSTASFMGLGAFDDFIKGVQRNPEFATKLGTAAIGAAGGAAIDPLDNPILSGLAGGVLGYNIPNVVGALRGMGVPEERLKGIEAGLSTPEGLKRTATDIFEVLPQIQRFNYLADIVGLPANVVAGPYGSATMGALEKAISGDARGWAALQVLSNPKEFFNKIKSTYRENIAEARSAVRTGEMGRGETDAIKGGPEALRELLEGPGTLMTAGDITARRILEEAGFTAEEARRMTLTSEPTGLFRSFANFGRGVDNPMEKFASGMMLPFKRTPANIAEQGLQRTPGLGVLYQALRENPDSLSEIAAQQLIGTGVGAGSAALGYMLPPEYAKYARRYVSNLGGQYSLIANAGFAGGQALGRGKDGISGAVDNTLQGLPVPAAAPLTDLYHYLRGDRNTVPSGVFPTVFKQGSEALGITNPTNGAGPRAPQAPTPLRFR